MYVMVNVNKIGYMANHQLHNIIHLIIAKMLNDKITFYFRDKNTATENFACVKMSEKTAVFIV